MRLRIINGRVIDPANSIDRVQDICIADGRIQSIGAASHDFIADREINAANLIVCPGLVDLSARLREPGYEHKATIASETRAAASGGITTLCCPPDTDPVIDTPAVAALIRSRAEASGYARVVPLGALTQGLRGEHISEMAALKEAGCAGVNNASRHITNTHVLRCAMEYAATQKLTVFLNPEDHWLRNQGCMHEGMVSTRLGLPGIPESAEIAAVARDLVLIEQTGVRAHFCRLSTARAARMIARARYEGLPVSADVSAHHLYLTEMDVGDFNSQCHIIPPLRTQRDRDGLRASLARGTFTAICSDHQPHEPDAKLAPFSATESGISALETLLPLALRLVDEDLLSLNEVIACLTHQPAGILGINAGTLSIGAPADICIFDPDHYWTVTEKTLLSRGRNTPFMDWELKGRVAYTVLCGKIVHELVG